MASSNCRNREEELIRAAWVEKMVEEFGYPRHLIAIEKELSQIPHLKGVKLPQRRVDILVFGMNVHPDYPLFPLLLIECKATQLVPKVATQALGYNVFVRAPFVALANATQLLLGSFDEKGGIYSFTEGLKSYQLLLERSQM